MGLESQEVRRKKYFCNMKNKKNSVVNPHFAMKVTKDNGEQGLADLPDEYGISGYPISFTTKKIKYKPAGSQNEKEATMLHLVLLDGEEEFDVSVGFRSGFGRNLVNNLLKVEKWGWLKIRVYKKDEYAQMYITIDDQPTGWKYDYEEFIKPLLEKKQDRNGDDYTDYSKFEKVLWEEIPSITSSIAAYYNANKDFFEGNGGELAKTIVENRPAAAEASSPPPMQNQQSTEPPKQDAPSSNTPPPPGPTDEPDWLSSDDDGDDLPF